MKKFPFLLGAAGALLTAAPSHAQTDVSARLSPTTSGPWPTKVYDYEAGTWSDTKSAVALAAEPLYDNTCFVATFLEVDAAEVIVDSGRLPSTTSPNNVASVTGTADAYPIAYFDVSYCTSEPTIDFDVSFYEQFSACDDATTMTPTEVFNVVGAPGASTPGVLECWTVTIDLGNLEVLPVLQADGDGVFDGDASLDNFGWTFDQHTAPANGPSGPVVAGDPFGILFGGASGMGCPWTDGLTWTSGTEGTGIGTDDFFEIDDIGPPPTQLGCYFFGGYLSANEWSSMFLEIGGDPSGGTPSGPGKAYCFGNTASGNPCPCSNDNDGTTPLGGCRHDDNAAGAVLGGSGEASVSNDTLVLEGQRGPIQNSTLFFQANNNLDGVGVFLGDGIRCAGGGLIRLKVKTTDANGDANSTPAVISARSAQFGHTIVAGETLYYQWWIRDPGGSPCGNENNTSNGYEITWVP